MKSLLILWGCLIYLSAGAQKTNYNSLLNKLRNENRKLITTSTVFNNDKTKVAVISERDANGRLLPGMHRGAIDNMPVLMPDLKNVAPIPNLYPGKVMVPFTGKQPYIPNPPSMQSFHLKDQKRGPVNNGKK